MTKLFIPKCTLKNRPIDLESLFIASIKWITSLSDSKCETSALNDPQMTLATRRKVPHVL